MKASVFIINRIQLVRLLMSMRFDESVKNVNIRILGNERILSPIDSCWDSFFFSSSNVSDDFMVERETELRPEQEI